MGRKTKANGRGDPPSHGAIAICDAGIIDATYEDVPAEFPFAYEATSRRARRVRIETLLGRDFVVLRRPVHARQPAFRVTYPHRTRDHQKAFDVLSYDCELWWPLRVGGREWSNRHLTGQECLSELRSGNWYLLSIFDGIAGDPTRPRPTRTVDDLVGAREIWCDDRETIVSDAKTRAFDNLLLSGGMAWVRGGEPVYLNSSNWTYVADVANPGADRSPRPWLDWLNELPGDFESAQEPIREGEFWTVDRYDEAEARAREHATHSPRIEVLLPDAMRLDPTRARLDAIFRLVFRFALWARQGLGRRLEGGLFDVLGAIVEAADEDGDDDVVDEVRLRALQPMRDFVEERDLPEGPHRFDMIHWDLRKFWASERRFIEETFARQRLAAEDDIALGSLAEGDS